MIRPLSLAWTSAIMVAAACGPNAGALGGGGGEGVAADSSSGGATSAASPTMTSTSNGSANGTGTTGMTDPSTGNAEVTAAVTTNFDTTTNGSATGTTGDSSSGEPPAESYPGCTVAEDCPEPYDSCWPPPEFGTANFCTVGCNDPGDCPLPTTGTATPLCEGPPGNDVCVLDCGGGDCPNGMTCTDVFGNGAFLRCTRR